MYVRKHLLQLVNVSTVVLCMQGCDNFAKGQVAQLVEQRTENPCVGGSIPSLATNKFNGFKLIYA